MSHCCIEIRWIKLLHFGTMLFQQQQKRMYQWAKWKLIDVAVYWKSCTSNCSHPPAIVFSASPCAMSFIHFHVRVGGGHIIIFQGYLVVWRGRSAITQPIHRSKVQLSAIKWRVTIATGVWHLLRSALIFPAKASVYSECRGPIMICF